MLWPLTMLHLGCSGDLDAVPRQRRDAAQDPAGRRGDCGHQALRGGRGQGGRREEAPGEGLLLMGQHGVRNRWAGILYGLLCNSIGKKDCLK